MRTKDPLVSTLLLKLARRTGVKVHLEPQWKFAGQITLPSGRKRYFRNTMFDLNTLGASEIAADKGYAKYFLRRMGYPTIPGKAFFSDAWGRAIGSKQNMHAAYRYAHKLGFPVIVKPNAKSQGVGVVKVSKRHEFYRAARFIFTKDTVMLVERALTGRDYRIVVLDTEVISAYERLPLAVVGDGKSTIHELLESRAKEFVQDGRDTQIDPDDFRIKLHLRRSNKTLRSIPARGERVTLLDNANLSTGGTAVDVTDVTHRAFRRLAVKITKDMGLRYCGVDLMLTEGSLSERPKKYYVIEINSAPGLDHYATSGVRQKRIVDGLYLKVLRALTKDSRVRS